MISITTHSTVQLLAMGVIILLAVCVVFFAHGRLKRTFGLFLLTSALWGLVSFMGNQPAEWAKSWCRFIAFSGILTSATYAYFISVYVRNKAAGRFIEIWGIIALSGIAVFALLGYIPLSFTQLEDGVYYKDYGKTLGILMGLGSPFMIVTFVMLFKHFRKNLSPQERNRSAYLLVGLTAWALFLILFNIFPQAAYTVDHIGHLVNAAVVTYAVTMHRLINLKVVLRKGVVYATITLLMGLAFALLFQSLQGMNVFLSTPVRVVAFTIGLGIMASLFGPLHKSIEKIAERVFYGGTYDYRKLVTSFATRMANVIDIQELAEAMLVPITKSVATNQASLLFASDDHFVSSYAERYEQDKPVIPISIRTDGPVIAYLTRENDFLSSDMIASKTEFKGMWEEDRNSLAAAQVNLLIPIKSKQKLNAVLAVSCKHSGKFFSNDDVDMLMTLGHEAAVVIENARLYESAKQRANIDELTDLFNHRYFHERLEEEIARCSRFGYIFSLIMIDMDSFKNYNDIHGHLAGDSILQQFSRIIKRSIRNIDVIFRYGGDEFAIILPETPLEGASKVAERIRRSIEAQTDVLGIMQTCSVGIASWPTDGVMREEIILSADTALYYAKSNGRNRISLAYEVPVTNVSRQDDAREPQNKNTILNTIYALAATVDAKDHHTYGHSKKVSKYATEIAEALGYTREQTERVRTAALLHDIGKIGISDNILTKRGPLTDEEYELIQAHPALGVSILKHVDGLRACLAAVQYHHEHYDGSGYPAGLKGQNIPIDARILSVADAYDAMTSKRPYRDSQRTPAEAMRELKRCSGTQFDQTIVETFVRIIESGDKVVGKV
ncbi:diguanylate cyclase [Chloroflexota bacterium]